MSRALVALNESDAVLALPTGDVARGEQAIRDAFQRMLTGRPVFTGGQRRPVVNGDLALTWTRLQDGRRQRSRGASQMAPGCGRSTSLTSLGRRGNRQQTPALDLVEHLDRPLRGGAVDPHPSPLGTPDDDTGLGLGQVGEGLPAQKLPRTYWTARSTLGLSCGVRTRAGSVANPTCWA